MSEHVITTPIGDIVVENLSKHATVHVYQGQTLTIRIVDANMSLQLPQQLTVTPGQGIKVVQGDAPPACKLLPGILA